MYAVGSAKITYKTVNKKGKNDFAYIIVPHYELLPTSYIISLYYSYQNNKTVLVGILTISRKTPYLQTIIQFI